MQRHAFFGRLNPGHRDQYIEAHNNIPAELLAHYRKAGIQSMSIFLRDDLLFLYLECEDFDAAMALLDNDPIELKWQKLINPMLNGGDFQKLEGVFQMTSSSSREQEWVWHRNVERG
jgi:L-rhamnose mutarotase